MEFNYIEFEKVWLVGEVPVSLEAYFADKHPIGDLMSIDEYRQRVAAGCFIPYDEYGYYCTDTAISTKTSHYYPEFIDKAKKKGYTKVLWFNR